jgi:thioredoxin-like negative regulator of GroEL
MAFYKALDLEAAGKYREAAPLFRSALHTSAGVNALLGLERAYAELGWSDSLLKPLDTLIASAPAEETYRTVQLRTLQSLGREAELRTAFERWTRDQPGSSAPYRQYARLLMEENQVVAADSILGRAERTLGTTKDLQLEVAQARAAQGLWVESATAWRGALRAADYLEQAAAYALAPTPSATRQQVRDVFLARPIEVAARRALSDLETSWGSAADGWNALKDLPPDSVSADAWSEFAKRAEADERWTLARDALEAALRWRRTPELALRAATAALNVGDAAAALRLAPMSDAHARRPWAPGRRRAIGRGLRSLSGAGRACIAHTDHRLGLGAHGRHGSRASGARRHRRRGRFERRGRMARAL